MYVVPFKTSFKSASGRPQAEFAVSANNTFEQLFLYYEDFLCRYGKTISKHSNKLSKLS